MNDNGRSYIAVQYFKTEDYEAINFPRFLPIVCDNIEGVDYGPQDPRCFLHRNDCMVAFNMLRKDGYRRMHLYNVTTGGGSRQLMIRDRQENLVEKNWTPFSSQDKLFFIYLFAPLVILYCDEETGSCQIVFVDTSKKADLGLRGGSPAIQTSVNSFEGYLHSVRPLPPNHIFSRDNLPHPAKDTPFKYRAHHFRLTVDESTGKWSVEVDRGEKSFFPDRQIEQIYGWRHPQGDVILNVDDTYTFILDALKN